MHCYAVRGHHALCAHVVLNALSQANLPGDRLAEVSRVCFCLPLTGGGTEFVSQIGFTLHSSVVIAALTAPVKHETLWKAHGR